MREIYQLKITAIESEPPIYRVLEVSGSTGLRKLNLYIQELFGFEGYHLFGFQQTLKGKFIGDINEFDTISGITRVKDYFKMPNGTMRKAIFYTYDFGDNWKFKIEPKAVIIHNVEISLPRCISGAGNNLIEDIGGIYSYSLVSNWCRLKNKYNYDMLIGRYGKDVAYKLKHELADYNPDYFDSTKVVLGKLKYIPPAD